MKLSRLVIISAILVGVLGGGIGGFVLWQRSQKTGQSEVTTQPTPPPPELLTWKDMAGFTFQYPKDLTVDPHEEDEENYAHVEFTHKDHPGNIIVWAKDTTAADVEAWVKTEKRFKGTNVMDTTLGGEPAKKVLLTTPANMLVTGTVFDDIVWSVEATLEDSAYWTGMHNTIADTFKFTDDTSGTGGGAAVPAGPDDGSEEWADEEEIIE